MYDDYATSGAPDPGVAPDAAPNETPVDLPSLPVRIIQVMVSPGALFEKLAKKPAWIGMVLFGGLISAGAFLLIPAELFIDSIREATAAQGANSPIDEGTMLTIIRATSVVSALVSYAVISLIYALFSKVIFSFILGDEGTVKQYYAAAAHAMIVTVLAALITIPLKIQAGDIEATLSVGSLMPFLEEGYFARFMSRLDLFWIWATALMGIGVSKIAPRRSMGMAIGLLLLIPLGLGALLALIPA